MKQALDLLDQILVIAQAQAADLDAYNIMRHKALKTVGKNAIVHNLEMLRELLVLEQEKMQPKPLYDSQDFSIRTCGLPPGTLRFLYPTKINTGDPVSFNGAQYSVSYGTNVFQSPGLPPNADKLPAVLNVGKRARITSHYWGDKTWCGREGIIVEHFINGDDCSGNWGVETYTMEDDKGNRFSSPAKYCELC